MSEELRAALVALGIRLNGGEGVGPTASQWNRNRPAGTPRAGTIARLCLGKVERFTFEVWVEVLALINLRYPPDLLAKARIKGNADWTPDVTFVSPWPHKDSIGTTGWERRVIYDPVRHCWRTLRVARCV